MAVSLHPEKLAAFVADFTELIDSHPPEEVILSEGAELLRRLVVADDWLSEAFARPHPQFYQQYLLHLDPKERFSVVSFVWGPGQVTPIHNHTVWGLIGMLRGAEYSQSFVFAEDGHLRPEGTPEKLDPGHTEAVSPNIGDIHQVRNALEDAVSISIHVYGANIGKVGRSVFYEDGTRKHFVSGYSNA